MADAAEINPKEKSIREQRDRFLAFSFASADLFIESSEEGRVTHALGAAKSVTGIDEKTLVGKKMLELFSVYEQARMIELYENAKFGARLGPMLINLSDALGARKAILTAIKMPGSGKFYLCLGLSNAMMARIAHAMGDQSGGGILDKDGFTEAALSAYARARMTGQNIVLTVIDFAPTGFDRKRIGEPSWKKLRESLAECLIAESADGYTAGEIFDGRFAVIHDEKVDGVALKEKIDAVIKKADPAGDGVTTLKTKSMKIDFKTLAERETEKGVAYAIDEFYAKGADMPIISINGAYEGYLMANNSMIKEFKSIIERTGFIMHYQPVVDLQSNEPRYYEMLCRFEKGDTREWIKFAEDMNLITDFDYAVCERAVNHVKFKAGNTRTKFSVNISPLSVENDDFSGKLAELLAKEKALADRIIIEISNSNNIRDLVKTEKLIGQLQALGFKIALDDFRDGTQLSDLLNKLHPDSVKIAEHHIKALLTARRDVSVVKNIIEACKALKIDVVGEYVEDKGQASVLRDLGANAAQGHYFGKASGKIEYAPPRDWS